MNWLSKNAESIEALAAVVTALVAVAALVGIKYQLDAADDMQRAQSAREAYRSHLAMASTLPEFAKPQYICSLLESEKSVSYTSFVDHLLYSGEQMLEVADGWETTFLEALEPHNAYICDASNFSDNSVKLDALLDTFRAKQCSEVKTCQ